MGKNANSRNPVSRVFDRIHFHTPGQLSSAYPYKLVAAGKARVTEKEGLTNRRFHQHLLILCTAGEGCIKSENREVTARKGTVVWLDTSRRYSHGCHDDASAWSYVWLGIQGYGLDEIRGFLKVKSDPVFHPPEFRQQRSRVEGILDLFEADDYISDSYCSAVISQLLCELVADRRAKVEGGFDTDWLGLLLKEIRSDITYHWTITELADTCNVSESQLFRKFSESVGTSPMNWLRHERMHIAKQLLVGSNDLVATVAQQCGYSDPYHFSRDFRRIVGLSPTHFRKSWASQAS